MANVLDGICPDTPLLDFIGQENHWPRSATRNEWFAITRQLIQQTIADMDLDPASLAEVEEALRLLLMGMTFLLLRRIVRRVN